jgi:nitroreductase
MIKDLVLQNRSYRRFDEKHSITLETLKQLVDLGRCSASGGNAQPLKYTLSCDPRKNALIFPNLAWARHLEGWGGPKVGERPSAYIVILLDKQISQSAGCDHGIAAQSILLGAAEKGLGGCMIASIKRKEVSAVLNIPDHLEILLVVAIGKPAEKVVLEKVGPEGSVKYYRDQKDVHHVPKRELKDIIIG